MVVSLLFLTIIWGNEPLGELETMDGRKIIFGLKVAEDQCFQAKIQNQF